MTKRYVLKEGVHKASLPGVGRVTQGMVLTGEEYDKYCPQILHQILDSTKPPPAEKVLTEPVEPPKVEATEDNNVELLLEVDPVPAGEELKEEKKKAPKKSRWRRRKEESED